MKKGMTKVSVLYPNTEGKNFDMDYYRDKHTPLLNSLLGDALKGVSIEAGLSGAEPDSPAPFAAIINMYFDSLESFGQAFNPNLDRLMRDLPNFTDIEPVVQISEVIV
ncbi:MAG: EthD family reductase [Ignavibacteriaceae bacterium]